MADTPAKIRDKALAKARADLKAGKITASEYRKDVTAANRRFAMTSNKGGGARAAAKIVSDSKKVEQGFSALNAAQKLKAPLATAGRVAKNIAMGGANMRQRAITTAALAVPVAVSKIREGAKDSNKRPAKAGELRGAGVAYSKGGTPVRQVNKPATTPRRGKRADSGDSARGAASAAANIKAGRVTTSTAKGSQNGSVGRTGAVHTVKKGDTLWDIAQANKTTVSALLRANPTIAKRKEAGKVTIFSGSKVRIPGKK